MTTTMLHWANFALAKGWYIFPCGPRKKTPNGSLVKNGVKDASNNPDTIAEWWAEEPEGNYGIALGPSGLTILDVDRGLEDVDAARAWAIRNQLPATFAVRTGRRTSFGVQFYFKGASQNKPYSHDGMEGEVRSNGYYVLGPGCVHDVSGERYEILRNAPLAPVPSLVYTLSTRRVPRPQGDSEELIEPSFRHYFLVERARELFYAGLDGDGLEAAIVWLYTNRCMRDSNKDSRIADREAAEIALWVKEHPSEYPLQQRDFIALRLAEKDPKVKMAWSAQLELFPSAESAADYLIDALRASGCGKDQVKRILSASPLRYRLEDDTPEHIKNA